MFKKVIRVAFIMICMVFLTVFISACEKHTPDGIDAADVPGMSFRDIPGITEDEIKAIEDLHSNTAHFIYAMPRSTEAFINQYGEQSGFSALFTQWLSGFFEIEFKLELHEWLDVLDGLESKEFSFSGDLLLTPERRAEFIMTESIATRHIKGFRIEGSRPLPEIMSEKPAKVGFMTATATINIVTSNMTPGTFEIVEFNYFDDIYPALKNGDIDVFYYSRIAELAFREYTDIVTVDFYPLLLVPISLATKDPTLEPVIAVMNKALGFQSVRRHIAELYNEGYRRYQNFMFYSFLSEEERAFIRETPVIPFAAESDNYPLSFFNDHDGEWQGIVIDVLREAEILSGLRFERINDETYSFVDLLGLLSRREVAFITELLRSAQREGSYLWTDTSLLQSHPALIGTADQRDVTINDIMYMNIGLISGYAHTYFFREWFPDHPGSSEYFSVSDAFDALDRGEIDAVMVGSNSLLALTHFMERPGFKIIFLFDDPYPSFIGLNRNEHTLQSILNKAMRFIDTEMISGQWTAKTYDYSIKIIEAQIPWITGAFIGLAVIVIILVLAYIRTNQLEQRRLFAVEANHLKSLFLATMSHEIRTPMNSIVGFSELALDDDISPRTRNYLNNILSNSEGLLQIINNILDISKIESGEIELESVPIDPNDLLEACKTIVMQKALDKGIKLRFYAELPPGKLPLGDPTRIRQVLVNLLSNAIKFTESGTVRLIVTVLDVTEDTITIKADVSDTGIGMTDEQIKRIFTPFMQAESETTRKYGGTGLGLTIAKNLLEMMGSKLEVKSKPGHGSTFSFVLTHKTVTLPEEELRRMQIIQSTLDKPSFDGEILLCEDNLMNQQVICEHLSRVGLKTIVAENGKIGLNMIVGRTKSGKKQFDLIFMDMHMPVMDGLEATSKINALGLKIPIIAMTANIMSSDKEQYELGGMSGYVGKPFTSQELWRCLLKFFEPVAWQNEDDSKNEESDNKLKQMLIDRFVEGNTNRISEIKSALSAHDLKLAHRLVHTLKSNAAQLGKHELTKAAEELEFSIKDGESYIKDYQMIAVEKLLTETLEELTPLVSQKYDEDETVGSGEFDLEETLKMFDELEPMLYDGDPDSLAYIDRLRAVPGSGELISQIDNFDFKIAGESLKKLKSELLENNK